MPLSAEEAIVVFSRKIENELEKADAFRMGLQLVQSQHRRITQLEQFIQMNSLQVPPMPGQGMPPNAGSLPPNMKPFKVPEGAAKPEPPQGDEKPPEA